MTTSSKTSATKPAVIVATIITGYGEWKHPIAVKDALCEDGVRRKIRLNQDGHTGRTSIKGKSLRGFVSYIVPPSEYVGNEVTDYQFVAYKDQSKD